MNSSSPATDMTIGSAALGSNSGNDEEVTEISISKGSAGLGLDLIPVENGKIIISVIRPYSNGNHPADMASPPLMVYTHSLVCVICICTLSLSCICLCVIVPFFSFS